MAEIRDQDLLLNRFYKTCADRPNDTYLFQPHSGGQVTTYTFGEVLKQAQLMAGHIKSLGFKPNTKIAIISKNCAHFFMSELAIWMSGNVSVALYPTLNEETVSYIMGHCEAKLLFVGKLDIWDQLKKGVPEGMPMIGLPLAPKDSDYTPWADVVAKATPVEGTPTRGADDPSLIIYTSGSTGQPKGVMHSFRTMSVPTLGLIKVVSANPNDRALSYLPLAHTMDRWLSFCLSLAVGNQVYFAESLDTFVNDLNRARPTLFVSVPRLWLKFQLGVFKKMPPKKLNLFLKIPILSGIVKKKIMGNLGLSEVRFAGSGSAPIPAELLSWYRNLGLELLEGYGMSENFNYSHITMPGKGRPGYIGNSYADVDCKISPEGEILIKSPGNMLGYYKDPERSAEAFTEDGYLRTGDRGEIDDQGRLRITGRVKELFKTSKGKYVAPVPIENIINNNPYVELCLVAGSGQVKTHAVIQLAEDWRPKISDPAVKAQITKALEELLVEVNGKIEEFERVGFLAVANSEWTIEDGQLTPTMKIRRGPIEGLYEGKLDGWYSSGQKVIWED